MRVDSYCIPWIILDIFRRNGKYDVVSFFVLGGLFNNSLLIMVVSKRACDEECVIIERYCSDTCLVIKASHCFFSSAIFLFDNPPTKEIPFNNRALVRSFPKILIESNKGGP